ncbi:MAG: hypothetical protein J0H27_01265 [Xanthomonadales bacterium]|nr:hypothetical protein [Xanthomonadales bacterium]ODU94778.1 MAG: hypothetical protein ABT18_02105 [Rhodanobacter sp. SCN 66-43]OJY82765.1 MAG: hypothetical protein BGP23_06565 [Xanthomonadales bacterium 66-474]
MFLLPALVAVASQATTVAAYPDGFTARCTGGKETSIIFPGSDPAHPILRRQDQGAYAVTIMRTHGRFEIELRGIDFMVVQAESREFHVRALKAEPGDLVLSVETDTWGRSLSVYHLRYAGDTGALTATTTNYRGQGSDDTTLMLMACKIGTQSSTRHTQGT